MWSYEYSAETSAPAETVFEIFRDVSRWPEWNQGVRSIELDGPFASGTTGVMTMPDGSALAFRLGDVTDGRGFEDETPIPDTSVVVRVRHSAEPLGDGRTRVTYRATVDGAAADALGPEIGPAVTEDFPEVVQALVRRAESVVV